VTPLEFETVNEPHWAELEACLGRAGRAPRDLDPDRFLKLYRMCCEHLALATARDFPAYVIERLANVTARAHQIIYRQSSFGLARMSRTLQYQFPAMVRANLAYVWAATLIFMVPAITVAIATYLRPELILSVVDSATAAQFEHMYGPSAESIGRIRDAGSNWTMFGFYIKNNIGIAFQCYATGIIFGLGSLFFLAFNGFFMGTVAGYIAALGYGATFFPFIATHSAFELTAIVLCGAAGLRIGRAMLLPGRLPRLLSLQIAARDTSYIVFGAAVMLVLAAAVEAFWSSAAWISPAAKYAGACACWTLVVLFFVRRPHAA
jgi:uncharacterized membrane protein SpoIIM required for sporulation